MKSARCLINDWMGFSAWNLCHFFRQSCQKYQIYLVEWMSAMWRDMKWWRISEINVPATLSLKSLLWSTNIKIVDKNKTSWTLLSLSGKRRLSYHQNLLVNATVTIIINGRRCPIGSMAFEFGNRIGVFFFNVHVLCLRYFFKYCIFVRDL